MRFGGGIFLLVVGAILAFAVRDSWDVLDLTVVGYICMAAGVLALVLAFVSQRQSTRTSHASRTEVVERRDDGTPPAPPPPPAR